MKTRMTRLGRRSPGRILAVPRPDTGDWPPAGASQWRPDGKGPQLADIIEVILADDKRIRRLLRALDDSARCGEDPYAGWMLAPVWCRLADLLEMHAEAEEEICYLTLFGQGRTRTPARTTSARTYGKRLHAAGSAIWWRGRLRPAGQQ